MNVKQKRIAALREQAALEDDLLCEAREGKGVLPLAGPAACRAPVYPDPDLADTVPCGHTAWWAVEITDLSRTQCTCCAAGSLRARIALEITRVERGMT